MEQAALRDLSLYFQTQVSSSTELVESYREQDGETSQSAQLDQQTLVQTETRLFAVRYTEPWRNPSNNSWEAVAYLDRSEAWALFEPRLASNTAPYMAVFEAEEDDPEPLRRLFRYKSAENFDAAAMLVYLDFAQTLHPARAAAFAPVRAAIAALPQRINQAKFEASVYVDCPVDMDGSVTAALTGALSAEGLPVTKDQAAASAVCLVLVDEGMEKREAGTFYNPALTIGITGKTGGALFSLTLNAPRQSVVVRILPGAGPTPPLPEKYKPNSSVNLKNKSWYNKQEETMNKRTNGKAFLHALMTAALFAAISGATFAQSYWAGSGAAGLVIAVLVPESRGLEKNEEYLPIMVQGVIVGDFARFSAMKVLDRQNLDKVIAEGESGVYENESGFVQLGAVANVQYVLNGALQKTGSGFSLQLKVTDAASGASKAAYTGNVTAAELENLTGIKKASGDLLAQLGVTLTDVGKTALLGAATSNAVAETALAKGITAQQSGTVVEALNYYYEAAKFDPGLAEAASRGSVLSADITSGNIGENVRNDIQRRAAWNKTFHEAAAFFREHPPFEIIYDPALTMGKIDYEKETAEMSFTAIIIGATGFKVIYDLAQGLEKTG